MLPYTYKGRFSQKNKWLGQVMPFEFRSLIFGIVTLLVILYILVDITEVEEEIGTHGGGSTFYLPSFQSRPNRTVAMEPDPSQRASRRMEADPTQRAILEGGSDRLPRGKSDLRNTERSGGKTEPAASEWRFNRTLSNLIRKNILKFLDAERDISILKGALKPGDVIHYIFDRQRTTNVSANLYRLLPAVPPLRNEHHQRCAIVGNSGILLNSSCGAEIDAHDFVIRPTQQSSALHPEEQTDPDRPSRAQPFTLRSRLTQTDPAELSISP
ncbi:hypothetical protein JZ751_015839 [Albula glossodonta]|uniref:Uncharacterized protein n=1 Tax=Albula glossodonta TaxID=121402 RepID=A0A8T2N164_9TELE|nr:hypothetical protein JZ751_015839 [Albula glossodonta]